MDTTLEIRWFGRGSPPDVLTRRSDALGAGSPEDRTDTYLRLNEFFVDPDLATAVGPCLSCAYPAWIRSEAGDHG